MCSQELGTASQPVGEAPCSHNTFLGHCPGNGGRRFHRLTTLMETAASDAHGAGRGEDQAAGEGSAPQTSFSAEAGERTVDSPRQQPTSSAGTRIWGKVPRSHARADEVVCCLTFLSFPSFPLFLSVLSSLHRPKKLSADVCGFQVDRSTTSSNSEPDCTGEVLSRTQKPCTMADHGGIGSSARFCYDDRIESPKYRAKGGWVGDGIDEVGSDEEQSEFKLTRFDMDSEEKYQVTCPLPVFSFSADFASPCSILRTPHRLPACARQFFRAQILTG